MLQGQLWILASSSNAEVQVVALYRVTKVIARVLQQSKTTRPSSLRHLLLCKPFLQEFLVREGVFEE